MNFPGNMLGFSYTIKIEPMVAWSFSVVYFLKFYYMKHYPVWRLIIALFFLMWKLQDVWKVKLYKETNQILTIPKINVSADSSSSPFQNEQFYELEQ